MVDLTGKVVVITGATSGIGAETALALARMGATIYVHGRSPRKIEAAVALIKDATGNADVRGLSADLSDLAQVRALAATIQAQSDRLDVLVNNAGGMLTREQTSVDGYELQFAVNHLSHFLLTRLLLGLMKDTASRQGEARIVNLSSFVHGWGGIGWDTLGKSGRGFGAYIPSKLANLLFTYELARRLEGSGVAANAVNPGLVATRFGKTGNPGAMKAAMSALIPISKSSARGAETSIYVASAPELKGVTGEYFSNCKVARSSKASHNVDDQRRLWELSEQMADVQFPR